MTPFNLKTWLMGYVGIPLALVAAVGGVVYVTEHPPKPGAAVHVLDHQHADVTEHSGRQQDTRRATQTQDDTRRHQEVDTQKHHTENSSQVIDRVYSPAGKLLREHIETRHGASTRVDSHRVSTQTQQHQQREQVVVHEDTQHERHAVVDTVHDQLTTPGHTDSGFSVGLMATPAGAGPAIAWELARLGPARARVLAGVVIGNHTPGPRLGLVVGGEVLPSVDLGLGAVIAPGSQEPLAYPVLGIAGIAPVVTLQYRF
jgi:hypothetical protein